MNRIMLATLVLAASGCAWVKLDDAGRDVRVAYTGDISGCKSLGEISVSVKDKVGPYRRNDLKVRDELETMARNEAVGLGADSIQPLEEPVAGEQRFMALRCGTAALPSRSQPPARNAPPAAQPLQMEEAQTYPMQDQRPAS